MYLRFSGPANAFFISTIRFVPDLTVAAINEGEIYNEWLSVYPNPFHDSLSIDIKNQQTEYSIYDLSGRKVECGRGKNSLENVGSKLSPAVYLLNVENPRKSITLKIVKVQK